MDLSDLTLSDAPNHSSSTGVVLVHLYNSQPNCNHYQIIQTNLTQFGEIIKILIFEKLKIIKAFVQFSAIVDAQKAIQHYKSQPQKQKNQFHISVYSSNLKEIMFQTNNSKGAYFYKKQSYESDKMYNEYKKPQVISSQNSIVGNSDTSPYLNKKNVPQIFLKTSEVESSTEDELLKEAFNCDNFSVDDQVEETQSKIDESDNFQVRQLMTAFDANKQTQKQNQNQIEFMMDFMKLKSQQQQEPQESKPLQQDQSSCVIYVSGIDTDKVTVQHVFNLFSNYGNIVKILYFKSQHALFIQFQNNQQAKDAKEYLSSIRLFGKILKIFYANFQTINLYQKDFNPNQIEILDGNETQYRFNSKKSISINPPNNVLHISNIRILTENQKQLLVQMFSDIADVEAFKELSEGYKFMCLLKLKTVGEATQCLCELHGRFINGRPLMISYTRSKI